MSITLTYSRPDGTYVGTIEAGATSWPYHFIPESAETWALAQEWLVANPEPLPPEPPPPPPVMLHDPNKVAGHHLRAALSSMRKLSEVRKTFKSVERDLFDNRQTFDLANPLFVPHLAEADVDMPGLRTAIAKIIEADTF